MDALIIAAGYGSRLADLSPSKPLTPVAGVPLIELGARQARSAGVSRLTVVTGHEADRVEAFLPGLAARLGMTIMAERIGDWSRPNGYSVMAGAARIAAAGGGDFLLMMADHIFSAGILRSLVRQGAPDRAVTLAVDTRIASDLIDPDDATWVQRDGAGRILAIGKTITEYDCVDCGAFLATQEVPAAIGAAIAAGKSGSLSDGMQYLADRQRAMTMDIGTDELEAWWMDVDDPRAHALAEQLAPRMLADIYA